MLFSFKDVQDAVALLKRKTAAPTGASEAAAMAGNNVNWLNIDTVHRNLTPYSAKYLNRILF